MISYANGNTITDYAAKQYGGLVKYYHLPLWKLFFESMSAAAEVILHNLSKPAVPPPMQQVQVCR